MLKKIKKTLARQNDFVNSFKYTKKYQKYSFGDSISEEYNNYKAKITRLYHTVEKGLTYSDYRPGFGRDNILKLINYMSEFSKRFGNDDFFYKIALDNLYKYISKNQEYSFSDTEIENLVHQLPGEPNDLGGTISVEKEQQLINCKKSFEEFFKSRHSVRDFDDTPVEKERIIKALNLASYSPSACNRQGWMNYILMDQALIKKVLKNQNGNRGFGDKFKALILVTFDLETLNSDREQFQGFIDGGIYSANLLNSLYYYELATVPLSASLTNQQEKEIRKILNIPDSEILILFIGTGNYKDACITTRSERFPSNFKLFE